MSSSVKPIKVWGKTGPNPPKVAILLSELGVPYEIVDWQLADVKKPEYVAVNPNGRLPTIEDPNTNLTLWESGAIIQYLIEKYDLDQKLSFPAGTNEAALTRQWLFYQTTGQGPYYGQAAVFHKFHHEDLPSAKERYEKEMKRVSSVLEGWLEKQKAEYGGQAGFDGPWLVGNKLTFADLSFITWQLIIQLIVPKEKYDQEKYPLLNEWIGKMTARKNTKKVLVEIGVSKA